MDQQSEHAFSTGEIVEPQAPEEHGEDGKRHVSTASYEGYVYACLCGETFMERSELADHIVKGWFEAYGRKVDQLRASRDTNALRASNAGTRLFLEKIEGCFVLPKPSR